MRYTVYNGSSDFKFSIRKQFVALYYSFMFGELRASGIKQEKPLSVKKKKKKTLNYVIIYTQENYTT